MRIGQAGLFDIVVGEAPREMNGHIADGMRLDSGPIGLFPHGLVEMQKARAPRGMIHVARAKQTAGIPDSPNAGWPMASIAVLLGCRLEKPGAYALYPDRPLPTSTVAQAGVRVVSRAGWLGIGATGVVVAGIGRVVSRFESYGVVVT